MASPQCFDYLIPASTLCDLPLLSISISASPFLTTLPFAVTLAAELKSEGEGRPPIFAVISWDLVLERKVIIYGEQI